MNRDELNLIVAEIVIAIERLTDEIARLQEADEVSIQDIETALESILHGYND